MFSYVINHRAIEIGITISVLSALQARGYDADQNMQALVQKQITKTILKMLLGAIQQDADDRGYEICTMLENSQQGLRSIILDFQSL